MTGKQKLLLVILAVIHLGGLYLVLHRDADCLFNDAAHRIGPGSDFFAIYNAGAAWRKGETIYDRGPGYGYRYHPILAMTVMKALTHLDYMPAFAVWVALQELLLLFLLEIIRRMVADTRRFLVAAALLIGFSPYYLDVYMGNASFMAASLLAGAFYFYTLNRYRLFFWLYILSVFVKPLGLLLLPILLIKRQFKLAGLAVALVAGLGLPYFLMYPAEWPRFLSVNLEGYAVNPGFLVHGGNQGFYALMLMLSSYAQGISTVKLYSLSQLPMWNEWLIRGIPYFFGLAAVVATYRWRNRAEIGPLVFVWSAVYLLGYKDVWEHTYAFAVLGLLYLWLSRLISEKWLVVVAVWLALPTAFIFYDMMFYSGAFNDPGWHWNFGINLLHHLTKPLPLLILFSAVVVRMFKNRPPLNN